MKALACSLGRRGFLGVVTASLLLLAAGCGPEPEPVAEILMCTPGTTQSCLGPGACSGAQVCLADGSSFGTCDCGAPAPSVTTTPDPTSTPNPGTTTPVDPNVANPDPGSTDPVDPGNQNPDPDPGNQNPDPDPGNQNPDPGNQNTNPGCPARDGISWPATRVTSSGTAPVKVIVDSVDFVNDRILLRNVTGTDVPMDNWGVHLGQGLLTLQFVSGFKIPANGVFLIHLRENGTNLFNEAFWGGTGPEFDLSYAGGDVSVHSNVDAIDSPDVLEAYVRWGGDPPHADQNHRDEAWSTGLWDDAAGAYVNTAAADAGLLAVGDITVPAGYTTVAGACMP